MRRRIDRRFLPAQSPPQTDAVANGAQATTPSPAKLDEAAELAQVNVLYSFLENRYSNKVRTALAIVVIARASVMIADSAPLSIRSPANI